MNILEAIKELSKSYYEKYLVEEYEKEAIVIFAHEAKRGLTNSEREKAMEYKLKYKIYKKIHEDLERIIYKATNKETE